MAKRGGRGKPSQARLEQLGKQFEGIMRADLKGAFSTFAKGVDYDILAKAVYSGDWREVFQTLPLGELDDAMRDGMQAAGHALVKAGGIAAEQLLHEIDLPEGGEEMADALKPTIDNDNVLGYVGTRTGDLIQNVTEDLQTNVQNAVAVGMTNNLSPRQVAGLIRDNLPLNNRQQRSFEKYRDGLAATELPKGRQAELCERYRDALTDERATTIARTETQMAIAAGQRASWNEAQRQGLIGYNSQKRWVTEVDPCAICKPMNGVMVGVNEMFTLPNGASVYSAPGHVNCRCSCALQPET